MTSKYTKQQESLIRELYRIYNDPATRLSRLPEFSHHSVTAIRSKARRMGVTKVRKAPKRWESWEDDLLRNMATHQNRKLGEIVWALRKRGSNRERSVVDRRLQALGLAYQADLYTSAELESLMRCGHRKIGSWVSRGLLPGRQINQNGDLGIQGTPWAFRPKDVLKFIVSHPLEVDGLKIDMVWLIGLIKEFRSELNGG